MNQVESCNSTFKQTFKHINSIWISLQYSFFFFRLNSRKSTSEMLNENKNSNEIFMCDFVQFICGEWWIMQSHEWLMNLRTDFFLWWFLFHDEEKTGPFKNCIIFVFRDYDKRVSFFVVVAGALLGFGNQLKHSIYFKIIINCAETTKENDPNL